MTLGIRAALAAFFMFGAGAASAQDMQIQTTRGLTADRPYSLSYPNVMKTAGGSGQTVMELNLPKPALGLPAGGLQVELRILPNAPAVTPEQANAGFNAEAVTAEWRKTFPDFKFASRGITQIRSGNALIYNGTLTSKAPGSPQLVLVRAEAADGGRLYQLDFYIDRASYEASRELVGFIVANFSTKSDGACCKDPSPIP
jgi:hypothetical protein